MLSQQQRQEVCREIGQVIYSIEDAGNAALNDGARLKKIELENAALRQQLAQRDDHIGSLNDRLNGKAREMSGLVQQMNEVNGKLTNKLKQAQSEKQEKQDKVNALKGQLNLSSDLDYENWDETNAHLKVQILRKKLMVAEDGLRALDKSLRNLADLAVHAKAELAAVPKPPPYATSRSLTNSLESRINTLTVKADVAEEVVGEFLDALEGGTGATAIVDHRQSIGRVGSIRKNQPPSPRRTANPIYENNYNNSNSNSNGNSNSPNGGRTNNVNPINSSRSMSSNASNYSNYSNFSSNSTNYNNNAAAAATNNNYNSVGNLYTSAPKSSFSNQASPIVGGYYY